MSCLGPGEKLDENGKTKAGQHLMTGLTLAPGQIGVTTLAPGEKYKMKSKPHPFMWTCNILF